MVKPVLNMTVPDGVKKAIRDASERMGCSQAEIVRTSIYHYLGELGLIKEQVGRSYEK